MQPGAGQGRKALTPLHMCPKASERVGIDEGMVPECVHLQMEGVRAGAPHHRGVVARVLAVRGAAAAQHRHRVWDASSAVMPFDPETSTTKARAAL